MAEETKLVQKVVRVPEPLVERFNEIHPERGMWTYFMIEVLRIYVESFDVTPQEIMYDAVSQFKDSEAGGKDNED